MLAAGGSVCLLNSIRTEIVLNELFFCLLVKEVSSIPHDYDSPGIIVENVCALTFTSAKLKSIFYDKRLLFNSPR